MYVLERVKNKKTFTIMVYEIVNGVKKKHKNFGRVDLIDGVDYRDIEISRYYYKYVEELNDSVTEEFDTVSVTGTLLINIALSYLGFSRRSLPYHYLSLYLRNTLLEFPISPGWCDCVHDTRRIYTKVLKEDIKKISLDRAEIEKKFNKKFYSSTVEKLEILDVYYEFQKSYYHKENTIRTSIAIDQNNIPYSMKVDYFKKASSKEILLAPDTILDGVSRNVFVRYFDDARREWKISYDCYDIDSYLNHLNIDILNTHLLLKSMMDKILWVLYTKIFNREIEIVDIKYFITNTIIYYWYSVYHNTSYNSPGFRQITEYLNLEVLNQRCLTRKEILGVLRLKEIKLKTGEVIKLKLPLCDL